MAFRFFRNLLIALFLFVIIGVIDEIGSPATNRFEEYLVFILTTDLDLQMVFNEVSSMEFLENFDLSSLLQGLPRITIGR